MTVLGWVKTGRDGGRRALGRGREMGLTTKFVIKFLTRK